MTTEARYNRGVVEAIRRAGSQKALARLLGVSQARVSHYLCGQPPLRKVLLIERKLGVPRHLTRPDVFGEGEPGLGVGP